MVHRDIFEKLNDQFDVQREFRVISDLFESPTLITNGFYGTPQEESIEEIVNEHCFSSWTQRGTCLSLEEMKERLCLEKIDPFCDEDNMIMLLEYFCNMMNLININLPYLNIEKNDSFIILEQNIKILLDHLKYEMRVLEHGTKVVLLPQDVVVTAVAEKSSPKTAEAIFLYIHRSSKEDLEKKRDILCRIYREYEPSLNKNIEPFNSYFRVAKGMLNCSNIRHNNTEGKNKKSFFHLTDEEMESLYDELFQFLLFCTLIPENSRRKQKFENILKESKCCDKDQSTVAK